MPLGDCVRGYLACRRNELAQIAESDEHANAHRAACRHEVHMALTVIRTRLEVESSAPAHDVPHNDFAKFHDLVFNGVHRESLCVHSYAARFVDYDLGAKLAPASVHIITRVLRICEGQTVDDPCDLEQDLEFFCRGRHALRWWLDNPDDPWTVEAINNFGDILGNTQPGRFDS